MLRKVLLLAVMLPLLMLALLPATAEADVFCAPAPCADGTPEATIATAIATADSHAGPDTVSIKAGTHNVGQGLQVNQPDTDVHGAGTSQTVLVADPFPSSDPGTGRNVIAGYMSRLADLTLRLPSAVTAGNSSSQGADVYNGLVEDVAIDAQGATFGPGLNDGQGEAMLIRNGAIDGLSVNLPADADVTGVRVGGIDVSPTIENLTIDSPRPLNIDPQGDSGPVTTSVKRLTVHSADPVRATDGYVEISDAVIDVSSAPSGPDPEEFPHAVQVADGRPPTPAGLTLDRVTLIGNGDANATAISLAGQGGTPPTYLRARHVAASGFGRTLAYQNYGSNPTATINFSNVPQGPGTIVNTGPGPATLGGNQTAGNRGGDPMLLPDLSLPFGSPAVDIGGAALLPGGPTDLAGNPRPADGDGNGTVLNDAGAFERVYTPDGATLTIEGKKVKLNKKGRGKVPLTCPPATEQPSPCTAKLKLRTVKKVKLKGTKKQITLAKSKQLMIPAGTTKSAKLKLKRAKLELLQESKKARKALATVNVADGNGESGTVNKKLTLKP